MSFDHMWALMVKQTSIGLITIDWYQKHRLDRRSSEGKKSSAHGSILLVKNRVFFTDDR
jgi:hypothetical protein